MCELIFPFFGFSMSLLFSAICSSSFEISSFSAKLVFLVATSLATPLDTLQYISSLVDNWPCFKYLGRNILVSTNWDAGGFISFAGCKGDLTFSAITHHSTQRGFCLGQQHSAQSMGWFCRRCRPPTQRLWQIPYLLCSLILLPSYQSEGPWFHLFTAPTAVWQRTLVGPGLASSTWALHPQSWLYVFLFGLLMCTVISCFIWKVVLKF